MKKEDILKELFGAENLDKVLPVFHSVYDELFKPEKSVAYGYGSIFKRVRNFLIPQTITSEELEEARQTLKCK